MFVRPKVRATAAVAASTAVLAAVMVPLAHADPAAELRSSFDQFAKTLPGSVQLAVAAAGSKDEPTVLKSSTTASPSATPTADSRPPTDLEAATPAPSSTESPPDSDSAQTPAWGSIRVPIALAAARTQSTSLEKVTAAIADSNSVAATELWKELGTHPGKRVTEVLAELGAKGTTVTGDPGTSYEDLAKTVWPVADQAAFGAGLLCAPDRSLVTSAMMQAPAADNGRWGLQDASGKPGIQFVAAHGGWGPIGTAYSARQFGLVQTSKGLMSVSISGLSDSASRDDAISIVTAATEWLTKNLDGLPAGFCSPSDQASVSGGAGSPSSTSTVQSSESSTSAEPSSKPSTTTESSSEQAPAETTPVEAGSDPSTTTSVAEPSTTSAAEPSSTESPSTSSTTPATPVKSATPLVAPDSTCAKTVIALDPGHNGVHIEPFDPVTGAKMVDDPNGDENFDAFTVAQLVAQKLGATGGYNVVLLKDKPMANVSYRDRVNKAEQAGAVMGVSIHTSPGDNAVFPQRVGLFREGPAADGSSKKVTFTVENVASRSALFSGKFARARSSVEGTQVQVRDNTFDGRAPLWAGNIPIISLISNKVPWVYNEFGPASGGGGANKIADSDLQTYADGLVAGIKASAPGKTCG